MKYLFYDVETTGLLTDTDAVHGDEVIQIGGVLTDDNLKPIRVFSYLCDTTKTSINKQAEAVHHITMETLRKTVRDIYLEEILITKVPELIQEKDLIIVGHNINFDIIMTQQTLRDTVINLSFDGEIKDSILPSNGRWIIDTMFYTKRSGRKSSYNVGLSKLVEGYDDFFNEFMQEISIDMFDTNYVMDSHIWFHDACIDAIYCYLVFLKQLWKVKLL